MAFVSDQARLNPEAVCIMNSDITVILIIFVITLVLMYFLCSLLL